MGKVMAALKAQHAATLDMAKAGPLVKARLAPAPGLTPDWRLTRGPMALPPHSWTNCAPAPRSRR